MFGKIASSHTRAVLLLGQQVGYTKPVQEFGFFKLDIVIKK
jgi:hypothetical protein